MTLCGVTTLGAWWGGCSAWGALAGLHGNLARDPQVFMTGRRGLSLSEGGSMVGKEKQRARAVVPSKLSWASEERPPCRSWSCRNRMMA